MGWCGTTETYCGNADPQGSTLPCQKDFGSCVVKSGKKCGTGSGTTNGRTIGYYQGSNTRDRLCNKIYPADIASKGYTHLYYAFASIDPNNFGVVPADSGDVELYKQFTALKSRGLQTSKLVSSASSRTAFINSLKTFMTKYGFQGVDLDWEYPVDTLRGGDPADTQNLVLLVREMHASFAGKFGLSLTLAPDYWYLRYFDAKAMESSVDFFGFMAYDLHGYWDQDVKTLGSVVRGQADIRDIATDTLPLWFDELDPSKINFGVALYGRGYTLASPSCNDLLCAFSGPSRPGVCTNGDGVMSLVEIQELIKENGLTPKYLPDAMMKQITWDDQWIGYDDEETIARKKAWADNQCFGGTMAWSIDFNSGAGSGLTPVKTTDGTCGKKNGNTVCGDWPTGNCCSGAGWCGSTADYCSSGCQSGDCVTGGETADGTCGLAHKHTTCGSWPAGNCCSAAGYCGNTKAHCGEGCQSGGCGWRILDGERGNTTSTCKGYDVPRSQNGSETGFRATAIEVPPEGHFYPPNNGNGRRTAASRSWWWAEIASVAGSIAAMVALVVVLALFDGRALSQWNFFIQPNTIISILVMVSKTSMLLAVSACLGQLKWKHFHDRPRPLSHLQIFDSASRGPLGSLFLMGNLRLGAVLAFFFAVVTTASVAIDPTAQQILQFPSRTAKLENVSSELGVAKQYASRAFKNKYPKADAANFYLEYFNGDTLLLQSSLLNAIFGSIPTPSYSCPPPATSCSWPDFSTLGVCRSFRNLTEVAAPECNFTQRNEFRNLTCKYDYTGRNRSEFLVEMKWNLAARPGTDGKMTAFPLDLTWYKAMSSIHTDGFGHQTLSMTSVKMVNGNDDIKGKTPPPTEMMQSDWYLCEHTHRGAAVDSGRLTPGSVVSEPLTPLRNTTVPKSNMGAGEGGLYDESFVTYRANSTGREYTVGQYQFVRLYGFLKSALDNQFGLFDNASRVDSGSRLGALLPMGYYMNLTDHATLTGRIADGVSAQMRGQAPGDNDGLTMLEGVAFRAETYIRVRWPWVLLALVEVVAAAVLVTATIFLTRGQPLLKSSVMALIWKTGRGQ
ncbi:glycoside hydrolase superfamily [Apiospora rasikravindrae]|uniref:chitinase n=1 Tax=Apiospora rasikravindrae TaxID=990691 RepID=A0ABR1TYR4_9PEZI